MSHNAKYILKNAICESFFASLKNKKSSDVFKTTLKPLRNQLITAWISLYKASTCITGLFAQYAFHEKSEFAKSINNI